MKDSFLALHAVHGSQSLCSRCFAAVMAKEDAATRAKVEVDRRRAKQVAIAAKSVILTTTPEVDGFRVVKYLGIESVEFVIGTGVFSEITTSIQDFFGARSSAFETKLRQAKTHAMDALKYLAAEKGANAVLSVDLDYTEFTGNRIALIINGTLVEIAPSSSSPQ